MPNRDIERRLTLRCVAHRSTPCTSRLHRLGVRSFSSIGNPSQAYTGRRSASMRVEDGHTDVDVILCRLGCSRARQRRLLIERQGDGIGGDALVKRTEFVHDAGSVAERRRLSCRRTRSAATAARGRTSTTDTSSWLPQNDVAPEGPVGFVRSGFERGPIRICRFRECSLILPSRIHQHRDLAVAPSGRRATLPCLGRAR